MKTNITKSAYGLTAAGDSVEKYTLSNTNGMKIDVITYGGIITSWTAPDKDGNYKNIVLGYDSLSQYLSGSPYFGAIIGRYGNRIANGKFQLDGQEYTLATNNDPNHLHGGEVGFDKVIWEASVGSPGDAAVLILTYTSPDGEEGYPGKLTSTVTYRLTNDDALEIDYMATTDQKTIVNLTQHSYFNLSGDFSQSILDQKVRILADEYLPVDETLIPTGEKRKVEGTPFDFKVPKAIGQDIEVENEQLKRGNGYDHCWVLNDHGSFRKVASAYHEETGRFLEVITNEPGIQFYTGNFLDGTLPAYGGGTYGFRSGFCLETQHFPDSPNQKEFPSVTLEPGQPYRSKTTYRFSVK
ncbi:aldose epimerase family protein [Portibacter marinus]|uniref:aldose epimerase family protein n=1 Tax=Portibacter marinus TaxID=2898660 RepID=UPI001F23BCFC|nr:aldose epimerase family protein [Portibacter marinus]